MKTPKFPIAAIVGLAPALAHSNDLTRVNFAVDPTNASSGVDNLVPGTVSMANGYYNNVSGPANFVSGQTTRASAASSASSATATSRQDRRLTPQ